MKYFTVVFFYMAMFFCDCFAHCQSITLTFNVVNNTTWIQTDSIRVKNLTLGGDTILYYPDTILSLYNVGIQDQAGNKDGSIIQSVYPNPVIDKAIITIHIPDYNDEVRLLASNLSGRKLAELFLKPGMGTHQILFKPGRENIYLLTVNINGHSETMKLINSAAGKYHMCMFSYLASVSNVFEYKASADLSNFFFNYGDELMYIAYVGNAESGMVDIPEGNAIINLQFSYNTPCPGITTVTYDGQVYNTIQIFSQCWLKENLNIGSRIPGDQAMTDNSIIEKYCYNNSEDSCSIYGGLYQWDEVMQYSLQPGVQGICPPGWHVPTDNDWKVLEGSVDSQYQISDPEWDNIGWRGIDAGENLKSISGWKDNGNGSDMFGFTALPSGIRDYYSYFTNLATATFLWSSTVSNSYNAWFRTLRYDYSGILRTDFLRERGHSVRCLKD